MDQGTQLECMLQEFSAFRVEHARWQGSLDAKIEHLQHVGREVGRIRDNYLSREDAVSMIREAIETSRRMSYRDIGALLGAMSAAVFVAIALVERFGLGGPS